ncbi:amidohydrolase [Maioricimonas sp. JC845]|uniref:M20 metallopeptidase family protein n=1 Tax=Maioricimonas sp. JC845 TaxID=3232138 RepID=UPI00345AC97B
MLRYAASLTLPQLSGLSLLTIAILAAPLSVHGGDSPTQWIDEHLDEVIAVYHDFHRHPELSFHEKETAARLASKLESFGAKVTTGVGGHGVVALMENGEGPTVMLRCDLDGLPVVEETGLDYASKVTTENADGVEVGVMHACGHDIHITNLVAVARYMSEHRDEWSGTLMLIGQPAEERGAGAKAMLEDGLFERFPRPDFAIAAHVDATLPTGYIGYRAGYALANVDSCDITVKGRGGHGSYPQGCIDPITLAAHLIVDLQTIVSREIAPIEPAVVTVGSIHGGTKHNIIPDECHLQLTIRSYSPDVRKHLREAIHRKAYATAESFRAPKPEVEYSEGTPSLFNDERLVQRIVPVFMEALGDDKVTLADRSMGGEDFSRYGRAGVPIFMFRVGSVSQTRLDGFATKGQTPPSLHSAKYYPDADETLETSIRATVSALMELLPARNQ